jgi:acetate kinase
MNLLVPNLGSTSLKYQILEMPSERVLGRGRIERVRNYGEAIAQIRTGGVGVDAVAFKAVHAGPRYCGTFAIDDDVLLALKEFLPAAPAHNAIYLAAIRAFRENMPGIPLVAAFEPEFHAGMPAYARVYGVPAEWRAEGVRKYGFHGASHQYVAGRCAALLGRQTRLVSCHMGGSSSMCAIDRGRSIDTTMGFSPQSGLENATRHGDLDAFAVLFMMERHNWTCAQVREQLATGGGLAFPGSPAAMCAISNRPPRAIRAPPKRCKSSLTKCGRPLALTPPPWAGSTPWPSPAALARTPPRCAPPAARASNFWGSRSIRNSTPAAAAIASFPGARSPSSPWPPTRS